MNIKDLEAFSLLVNFIPQGDVWIPDEDNYLWDVYEDVLKGMDTELASSVRTDREETQYQEATAFLRTETEAGFWEDSAAVKTYKQYRDQLFTLQESYNAAKSTGEMSQDESIKEQWKTVEEPKLRQAIQALETEWVNGGFKHEVEQAQQIRVILGAKSPFITWSDWCSDFMEDIDELTDTDNSQFYPSSFSPMNAIADGSWQTFTLTADEIPAMIAGAPKALKSRLQAEAKNSDIVSMSFEFSSAKIVRNWMNPDVFQADFWRFIDKKKQLSDGQTPPAGDCPAYTTAVVFARNIIIHKRKPTDDTAPKPKPPTYTGINPILFSSRNHQLLKVSSPQPSIAIKQPIRPKLPVKPRLNLKTTPKPNLSAAKFSQTGKINYTAMHSLKAMPKGYTPQVHQAQPVRAAKIAQSVQAKVTPSLRNPQRLKTFQRLQKASILRPKQTLQITKPDAGSSPPSKKTPNIISEPLTQAGEICILAFICKRLPKCPNPDPTLQW